MIGIRCTIMLFYNIIVIFSILSAVSSNLIDSIDVTAVKIESIGGRIDSIPIIYVQGTHYEVGHTIGNTFAKFIQDYVQAYQPLQNYLKLYNTKEGLEIYHDCLNVTTEFFPQYVIELKAMAVGSGVPFVQLFLIHMNEILPSALHHPTVNDEGTGCSTLLFNMPEEGQYIAHNEDALNISVDQLYIVNAHIIPSNSELGGVFGAREEKWSALTYAGSLSGYGCAYNHHGVVFSVNTIFAKTLLRKRIPRTFITRALLAAEDTLHDVQEILENIGTGTADAFHVSLGFLNRMSETRVFYSIEVTPSHDESKSNVLVNTLLPEYSLFYTNKLLYSSFICEELQEAGWKSSNARETLYKQLAASKPVRSLNDILRVLGGARPGYRIYRSAHDDSVNTISTIVFDFMNRKWILWTKNPRFSKPFLELSLTAPYTVPEKKSIFEEPFL